MDTVYLLHFDRPLAHARHYVGFTTNLEGRLGRHENGRGSRLVDAVLEAGIGYTVVRTWPGRDRHFERKLKKRHNTPQLCPICNPNIKLEENERPESDSPQG